jgi:hypothetical protein
LQKTNHRKHVANLDRWHADIKPDNILVVHGEFKLADPGFARFVKKSDREPEEFMLGGTVTYGK